MLFAFCPHCYQAGAIKNCYGFEFKSAILLYCLPTTAIEACRPFIGDLIAFYFLSSLVIVRENWQFLWLSFQIVLLLVFLEIILIILNLNANGEREQYGKMAGKYWIWSSKKQLISLVAQPLIISGENV